MKTPRTAIVAPHHEHPRPLPRLPHGAARSHGPRSAGSNPALRRVVLGGVLLAGALLWCAGSDLSAASSSPPDLPDPAERLRLLEAERPQGQAPAELRRGQRIARELAGDGPPGRRRP
ncbi:MAG: hypothetical protein R3E12_11005 [Candidatus Eisenbacteria bacterium]